MKSKFLPLVLALLGMTALWTQNGVATVRFFFSQVGPPVLSDPLDPNSNYVAPAPLTVGDRPVLTLNAGQTGELHVWAGFNNSPPVQNLLGASIDVDSSNPLAAYALTFDVYNPLNTDSGTLRWDAAQVESVNVPAMGTDWVTDAVGVRVAAPGIGNSFVPRFDTGRDFNTRSFYFGKLTFQAPFAGPGTETTGLYFRTGIHKILVMGGATGATGAIVQFVDDATTYDGGVVGVGDPITADLEHADAIINVVGVPEPSSFAIAALALLGVARVIWRRRRA